MRTWVYIGSLKPFHFSAKIKTSQKRGTKSHKRSLKMKGRMKCVQHQQGNYIVGLHCILNNWPTTHTACTVMAVNKLTVIYPWSACFLYTVHLCKLKACFFTLLFADNYAATNRSRTLISGVLQTQNFVKIPYFLRNFLVWRVSRTPPGPPWK